VASVPGVTKEWSADALGSAISSQGTSGYISVMVALKFIYSLNKGLMFCSK